MHVADVGDADSGAVGQALNLLHHIRLDVGRGLVVAQVERRLEAHLHHFFQPFAASRKLGAPRRVGNVVNNLALKVVVHLSYESGNLGTHELPNGVPVLVRAAPHVDQVLLVALRSDRVEFAIRHLLHEFRRSRVDRIEVARPGCRIAVACRTLALDAQSGEEDCESHYTPPRFPPRGVGPAPASHARRGSPHSQ